MSSIIVYQADALGFFLYPTQAFELPLQPGDFNIPYGALIEEPPAASPGFVARTSESGWQLVEDHRQDRLFYELQPAAGDELAIFAEYTTGSQVVVDGQTLRYDGGGPVPAWLISQLPEKGRLLVPLLE
ncbi:phage tail protein [Herbaspirillum aquaticum]|uniref:Phage tail protein n=1 Tax=Herbaspirillum aquaticum TaxID=568783 RepID=A0A225SNJ9_9BURK|nr:phage tail protein [Herbaspirillum aquaticum]OWY32029.1 phage tail protein [Herbaspirillum aquaticum]